MDVAREVASVSINMPVKDAWNSESTAFCETGFVEGLGVDWCNWVRLAGFWMRGRVDSELQPATGM